MTNMKRNLIQHKTRKNNTLLSESVLCVKK